jgi:hypothetical protein
MSKIKFDGLFHRVFTYATLFAGLIVFCVPFPAARAAGFQIVPSANQANLGNHLYGVSAVATDDIWSVGDYNDGPYRFFARTLTEHWDGSRWTIVPSPSPFIGTNDTDVLSAVAAIGSDDVWAVGYYADDSGINSHTLALHWNGSAWGVVPTPDPSRVNYLYGVAAIAPNDIWAVGFFSDAQSTSHSLTLHWDGNFWSQIPNPGVSALRGVDAVSSNDVWAVSEGSEFLHWDGHNWTLLYGPQRFVGYLEAVAAVSSNDVWVVGYKQVLYDQNTVTLHWNGSKWSLIQAVNPHDEAGFYGVTALAPDNVLAVGFQSGKPLVEKWDGRRWSVVDTPTIGTFPTFQAATFVPGTNSVWAVGWDYQHTNIARTLTESMEP